MKEAELILLSIALICFTVRVILRFSVIFRVKSKAEQLYASNLKIKSVTSVVFGRSVCLTDNIDNNISVVFVSRKNAKYHFVSPDKIEIYVGTRETYKTGAVRYSIGKTVNWKLKSRIKLNSTDFGNVVLFTKQPMDITSSDAKSPEYLGNGDVIFENTLIYSTNHFLNL